MSKTQRTVTVALWALVVVSLLSLIAMISLQSRHAEARQSNGMPLQPGQVYEVVGDGQLVPATQGSDQGAFDAPSFKLTDQDGQPFDSDALRGKVWTASFFFSRCAGVCPGMMKRVQDLQQVTNDPNVHFVYLTVDPARDTVERLREYASESHADAKQWHMLTGSLDEMHRVAADFRKAYTEPALHTSMILLVDQKGSVVGEYDSRVPQAMFALAADLKKLTAGQPIENGYAGIAR